MTVQPPIPGLPVTLATWLEGVLVGLYPDPADPAKLATGAAIDPDAVQVEVDRLGGVPSGLLPPLPELARQWLRPRLSTHAKSRGLRLTRRAGVKVWVDQLQLPLAEFQANLVGRLRLARADQDAVLADTLTYAEAHPGRIPDVATFVADIRKAAGL